MLVMYCFCFFYLFLFPVLGLNSRLASRGSMVHARITKSMLNSTNCSTMAVPMMEVSLNLFVDFYESVVQQAAV